MPKLGTDPMTKKAKGRSPNRKEPRVCEQCGKKLPDEITFRRLAIRASKEGFFILQPIRSNEDVDYCLCRAQIMSRLRSVRNRRSRIKRMMVFVARFRPHEWKTKRILLERKYKQKVQRHLRAEELVLWDWQVFESNGNPHSLEEVLDTQLVKDLLKVQRKSLPTMRDYLSRIVDKTFVTAAVQPPFNLESNPLDPDLEDLWRRRLDDEE
jgi:hypothetical protein